MSNEYRIEKDSMGEVKVPDVQGWLQTEHWPAWERDRLLWSAWA